MDELRTKLVDKVEQYLSKVTGRGVTLSSEGMSHKNSYNVYVDGDVFMYTFPGGYKSKFIMPYEGMLFAEKEYYDEIVELINENYETE